MDQTSLIIIGVAALVAICIVALGFTGLGMASDKKANKRISRITSRDTTDNRNAELEANTQRRKAVQKNLKELETQQKERKKKLTLRVRLERADLNISVRAFYIWSCVAGIMIGLLIKISGLPALAAVLGGFAGGLGLPRWTITFLTKRRQRAFGEEFANAVDVIVRGVKSGLPVNDCLKIIGNESPEPVGSEFRELVEAQKLGIPLDQALERIYERMPLAEVNFFMIVIAIQQKTGGNLSEALGNLSRVLRERKKMRGKIQAMSQEAKASAGIIGSLPPAVMGMTYMFSPDYISLLFTTSAGNLILIGSLMWMGIGIFVMKKMINFNF